MGELRQRRAVSRHHHGSGAQVVKDFVKAHPEKSVENLKALGADLISQPHPDDKLAGTLLLSEHLLDHLGR